MFNTKNLKLNTFMISFIILYPLFFIWQGIDFTDRGYWLTNYNLIFNHPENIKQGFSCYLSVILGGAWLKIFNFLGILIVLCKIIAFSHI